MSLQSFEEIPLNGSISNASRPSGIFIAEDDVVRLMTCKLAVQNALKESDAPTSLQTANNLQDFYAEAKNSDGGIYLLDGNMPRIPDGKIDYVGEEMLDWLTNSKKATSDRIFIISNDEKFRRYAAERGCVLIDSQ
jgi:hypothetical protein